MSKKIFGEIDNDSKKKTKIPWLQGEHGSGCPSLLMSLNYVIEGSPLSTLVRTLIVVSEKNN